MSSAPAVPTLTDGRVVVRGHRPDDVPGVYEQCQDPETQRWTTIPVPYALAHARLFVEEVVTAGWADGSMWSFAVEHRGEYAGTVELRPQVPGVAEVAYAAHPGSRGTGVLEAALRLLLDWGFGDRGLETVVWRAHVGNWASRRLAWRLGFAVEGTVRRWLPQRGVLHDGWVGTLLRDDPREPSTRWLECPVVEARGLRLRPMSPDDAPRIQEACSDEETQRWLGQLPSPYTLDDALAYVESRTAMHAEGRGETWAVTLPGDDLLRGTVGWFNGTAGVDCEIGYWAHPDSRGRGLTSRALAAVTDYAVDRLGVQRVTCFAAVGNTGSRRVIEANGYRQFGVERLAIQLRDRRTDMALYDVLADEWRERRSSEADHSRTAMPATESAAPTSAGDR